MPALSVAAMEIVVVYVPADKVSADSGCTVKLPDCPLALILLDDGLTLSQGSLAGTLAVQARGQEQLPLPVISTV